MTERYSYSYSYYYIDIPITPHFHTGGVCVCVRDWSSDLAVSIDTGACAYNG